MNEAACLSYTGEYRNWGPNTHSPALAGWLAGRLKLVGLCCEGSLAGRGGTLRHIPHYSYDPRRGVGKYYHNRTQYTSFLLEAALPTLSRPPINGCTLRQFSDAMGHVNHIQELVQIGSAKLPLCARIPANFVAI